MASTDDADRAARAENRRAAGRLPTAGLRVQPQARADRRAVRCHRSAAACDAECASIRACLRSGTGRPTARTAFSGLRRAPITRIRLGSAVSDIEDSELSTRMLGSDGGGAAAPVGEVADVPREAAGAPRHCRVLELLDERRRRQPGGCRRRRRRRQVGHRLGGDNCRLPIKSSGSSIRAARHHTLHVTMSDATRNFV